MVELEQRGTVEERKNEIRGMEVGSSKPLIYGPRLIYTPYKRSKPLQKFPFIPPPDGWGKERKQESLKLRSSRMPLIFFLFVRPPVVRVPVSKQVSNDSIFSRDTTNLAPKTIFPPPLSSRPRSESGRKKKTAKFRL